MVSGLKNCKLSKYTQFFVHFLDFNTTSTAKEVCNRAHFNTTSTTAKENCNRAMTKERTLILHQVTSTKEIFNRARPRLNT